jgi:ComF family protein
MVRSLINLGRSLLEIVYPTSCGGGCGRQGEAICSFCAESFVRTDLTKTCVICGRWLGISTVCGDCSVHPQTFSSGFFGYSFEGPVREALHAFKFAGRKDVGRALVRGLSDTMAAISRRFDTIIPLPVTEKRLKKRGFNQSYIIGEEISRITGRALDYRTLIKVRETQDQFTLSKEERRKNVKNAFVASEQSEVRGRRILLIDDLYTTGNTAREACRVLAALKPAEILFFALARTPE